MKCVCVLALHMLHSPTQSAIRMESRANEFKRISIGLDNFIAAAAAEKNVIPLDRNMFQGMFVREGEEDSRESESEKKKLAQFVFEMGYDGVFD